MTLDELEKRIKSLEVELNLLRHEVLRLKGFDVIPGIGVIGAFKDDPSFDFVVRAGREYRDKVNRESLEEMDREERETKVQKAKTGKPKPRRKKTDARP
jgi:hypothetical protein